MDKFSPRGGQAAGDLSQGIGADYLGKQHGNELIPTTKSLGVSFCFVVFDDLCKCGSVDQSEDLRKTAGCLYHGADLQSGRMVASQQFYPVWRSLFLGRSWTRVLFYDN
jgi:hypothetical protein